MDGANLVDTMMAYVTNCGADLVILAHAARSTGNMKATAILGSVTVSCIRRFTVPIMVVNGNAHHITNASVRRESWAGRGGANASVRRESWARGGGAMLRGATNASL